MIRLLDHSETRGPDFRKLLHLACEVDDHELDTILAEEIPLLTVLGDVTGSRIIGFAAFDSASGTLEYIAVDAHRHGTGLGTRLIREVRGLVPAGTLRAETDDDAVDFYRRLGFTVTAGESDPRWPERRRYSCLLSGSSR